MRTAGKRKAAGLLAAAAMSFSGAALATNGYFTHGVGTESKGMAGTGVGDPTIGGPIVVATNPALGVFASERWELGLSFFSPRRSYAADTGSAGQGGAFSLGAADIGSSSNWFPIPYVAKNWEMGNENALTFVFYGRGGMNTDWDDAGASAVFDPTGQGKTPVTLPGVFGDGEAGVDLSQAFMQLNYAGKMGENFSWGIGPVFAVQAFEAKGVGNFAFFTESCASTFDPLTGGCTLPTSLTDNGHDISTGFGFAGGVWWQLNDTASVGLAYQSEIAMSEFDDYSDLFAEDGGFDIPSSLKAGLSFMASEDVRVNVDVEHTTYSDIASVGNPMINFGSCPTTGFGGMDPTACLGGANGAGFGWEDMTTYKVGLEWASGPSDTYRFGYSYGEQPIQAADVLFNILAPGVMEQHFTFGWTHLRDNGGAWNVSIMYAPEHTVTGRSLFDPAQTVELTMQQFEFEISYLW